MLPRSNMAAENPVKSADRVLNLLELLAFTPTAQSFTELSQALAIPKSSLFQLLKNLLNRGYVRQDKDTGRYLLGDTVRELVPKRRSEEHASELQSQMRITYAVFRLKKKKP